MHLFLIFTTLLKSPAEVGLVVEEEADNIVEDVRSDETAKEMTEVFLVAEVSGLDEGIVEEVEAVLVCGKDVSWGRFVVVTTMMVEETCVDISGSVEVLRVDTIVLVTTV